MRREAGGRRLEAGGGVGRGGFLRYLKQICGMPDYQRHWEHASNHGCRPLSEREYYDQYLAIQYGGGGSRCC